MKAARQYSETFWRSLPDVAAALGFAVSAWTRLIASLFAHGREPAYRYLRESIRDMETESGFLSMAAEAGFRLRRRRWFFPCCTCLHLVNGGMP